MFLFQVVLKSIEIINHLNLNQVKSARKYRYKIDNRFLNSQLQMKGFNTHLDQIEIKKSDGTMVFIIEDTNVHTSFNG